MRDVSIVGIGQTKVKEHWDRSLRDIAVDAILVAMADANLQRADALYVGNMLSGTLSGQENLGALIADYAGLRGIEAIKVEAACGSGAAAIRQGYFAIASGLLDSVIVCGVEKMTETLGADTTAALAMAGDAVAGEDAAARVEVLAVEVGEDASVIEALGVVDEHERRGVGGQGSLAVPSTVGNLGHVADEVEEGPFVGERVDEAGRHHRHGGAADRFDLLASNRGFFEEVARTAEHDRVVAFADEQPADHVAIRGLDGERFVALADFC